MQECASLAELCTNTSNSLHPDVRMVATMGRAVYEDAEAAGYINVLQQFGVEFVTDTCWYAI